MARTVTLTYIRSGNCVCGLNREILDHQLDHEYYHNGGGYTTLDCAGCDRIFSRISSWLQHIESPCCSNCRDENEDGAARVVARVLSELSYDHSLELTEVYGIWM